MMGGLSTAISRGGIIKKFYRTPSAVLALGAALAMVQIGPAAAFAPSAAPLASAGHEGAHLTDVRFRGGFGHHGFGRRAFGHRRFHRRFYGGGYGGGVGAGLAGLAAGALIGDAIASSEAAPVGDTVGYCESHFKSYNPATGTYLGYDGEHHPCP